MHTSSKDTDQCQIIECCSSIECYKSNDSIDKVEINRTCLICFDFVERIVRLVHSTTLLRHCCWRGRGLSFIVPPVAVIVWAVFARYAKWSSSVLVGGRRIIHPTENDRWCGNLEWVVQNKFTWYHLSQATAGKFIDWTMETVTVCRLVHSTAYALVSYTCASCMRSRGERGNENPMGKGTKIKWTCELVG